MKVEMKIDWDELPEELPGRPEPTPICLAPPNSKAEWRLWYIALGLEIEAGIRSGRFKSQTDAALQCRVSKARISGLISAQTRFQWPRYRQELPST